MCEEEKLLKMLGVWLIEIVKVVLALLRALLGSVPCSY